MAWHDHAHTWNGFSMHDMTMLSVCVCGGIGGGGSGVCGWVEWQGGAARVHVCVVCVRDCGVGDGDDAGAWW